MNKLFFLLTLIYFGAFAQDKYQIEGVVLDHNKQPLNAVNVGIKNHPNIGSSTDKNGFFHLEVAHGNYILIVQYLGFATKEIPLNIKKNTYLNIVLESQNTSLNEIVVSVKETSKKKLYTLIGTTRIKIQKIKQIPMLFGERDVLKAVQLLPGVKATSEGSSGFSVHGGSNDQNLILLDGAPIYHPSHLFGFFSVFTPDVIKDLHLYKSSIPPTFGNRLASILDVSSRNGNQKEYHFGGSIGLISAQLFAEGPIKKDKASFILAARRTYADLFTPLLKNEDISKAKINFYDLNLKLHFELSKKSDLSVTGYKGRDVYVPNPKFDMNYGNEIGAVRFKHRFNNHFKSKTQLIYSKYDYDISLQDNVDHQDYDFDIGVALSSQNIKQDFTYQINQKNKLNFGADLFYHNIKPGTIKNNRSENIDLESIPERHALETGLYAQHQTRLGKRMKLSYGLRASIFSRMGPETFYKFNELGETIDTIYAEKFKSVKTFTKLAPRVALNIKVRKDMALKMSYDRTYQFLHYLINDATTTPTDLWIPSGINLKPQSSDQYSLEINKAFGDQYFFSIGGYYRDIQNITDYKIGTSIGLNSTIEKDLLQGIGRAYGLEVLFKKSVGKFTGSLAYTLSKTEKKFNEEINNGNWYPAAEDHPNDISISGVYKFSKRAELSALWVFYNGRPITYPAGTYEAQGQIILFFSHRNANRLPDYHRLDLSFTLHNKDYKVFDNQKVKKKYQSSWNFSIYNAYARDNTYMVKFKYDEETEKINAYRVTLFKFIPSISYHFRF